MQRTELGQALDLEGEIPVFEWERAAPAPLLGNQDCAGCCGAAAILGGFSKAGVPWVPWQSKGSHAREGICFPRVAAVASTTASLPHAGVIPHPMLWDVPTQPKVTVPWVQLPLQPYAG